MTNIEDDVINTLDNFMKDTDDNFNRAFDTIQDIVVSNEAITGIAESNSKEIENLKTYIDSNRNMTLDLIDRNKSDTLNAMDKSIENISRNVDNVYQELHKNFSDDEDMKQTVKKLEKQIIILTSATIWSFISLATILLVHIFTNL